MERLDKLAPLNPLKPLSGEKKTQDAHPLEESVFGAVFRSAIDNVKETDAEMNKAQYLLATGQLDNPAQVGIAAYKAEISVSLLLQMRDRALTAYNELRNMNV